MTAGLMDRLVLIMPTLGHLALNGFNQLSREMLMNKSNKKRVPKCWREIANTYEVNQKPPLSPTIWVINLNLAKQTSSNQKQSQACLEFIEEKLFRAKINKLFPELGITEGKSQGFTKSKLFYWNTREWRRAVLKLRSHIKYIPISEFVIGELATTILEVPTETGKRQ